MNISTKFNLGDIVQYDDTECKIIRVKILQDLFTDKQPRVFYYLSHGEGIEVRTWTEEKKITKKLGTP